MAALGGFDPRDEPTAGELRRRCDAHMREHGIDQIVNRTHYALA